MDAHFDRQKPVGCVDEMNRQFCRLEIIEHGRERSALESCLNEVRKRGSNADAGACCVKGRLDAADNEPRMHRNRNIARALSSMTPIPGANSFRPTRSNAGASPIFRIRRIWATASSRSVGSLR
jgi:hypothetical protein